MSILTYVSGEIDLALVSNENRDQIKRFLQAFYGLEPAEEIFRGDYISFDDEWSNHEETDRFLHFLLMKIIPLLNEKTVARLSCEGETHKDYWGIIIKKGKLYIQKYKLVPAGDKKEFGYSPIR